MFKKIFEEIKLRKEIMKLTVLYNNTGDIRYLNLVDVLLKDQKHYRPKKKEEGLNETHLISSFSIICDSLNKHTL